MATFYGDISVIRPAYLLKATPYTKETTVNFCGQLTKEEFFNHLYAESSKKTEFIQENQRFDKAIDYELKDLRNPFAKVSVLNITGYAGAGKTTFLHHLLWTKKDFLGIYDVIDYEGCSRAIDPFIDRISSLFAKHTCISDLRNFLKLTAQHKLLNITRFCEHTSLLVKLNEKLESDNKLSKPEYSAILNSMVDDSESESAFLGFLFFVELMLLLCDKFLNPNSTPMILAIDNADSMNDLAEENILLPVLYKFANDCTFFFSANLDWDASFCGHTVPEVMKNTKLLLFITTRYVTIKRYESIEPDLETVNGWVSHALPENYYDHRDIISRRVDYYDEIEHENFDALNELHLIRDLGNVAYHDLAFMRLFNGNVRYCVERLCDIERMFSRSTLEECLNLYKEYNVNPDVAEGAKGYFLYLLLCVFKANGIYSSKLGLSALRKDGTISLSRVVLTIIRENQQRCSMLRLFKSLVYLGYSANEICTTVWNLCEIGRKVWRRLVIFDMIIPKTLNELQEQATLFQNGETDIEKYSEVIICTAGLSYMELVVPHFEFMLSRQEQGGQFNNEKYEPLFSSSSEDKIQTYANESVYRFEKKIDSVYSDVEDCCYNSNRFAEKVMKSRNLTREEYIVNTSYNYHKLRSDDDKCPKQSYESRLIFRHIGYIERYRCYLLTKYSNEDSAIRADINRRIVTRILRYLSLYRNPELCIQTTQQDQAANKLYELATNIKNKNYYDFKTKIELGRNH